MFWITFIVYVGVLLCFHPPIPEFDLVLAVVAVSNGVHAWKILQDLTNHIDLILTEVVMPCVSGIGLLCKIMSHKTCKNIPVISK